MSTSEIARAYDALHQLGERIGYLDSALADMREASDAEMYDPALIYGCLLDLEQCRREFANSEWTLRSRFSQLVHAFKALQNEYIDLFIEEVTPNVARPMLDAALRAMLVERYLHHLSLEDQDRFMWLFMGMYNADLPIVTRDAVRAILTKARDDEANDYLSEGLA